MPRQVYPWERGPVLMVQEAGWNPGPVWTGAENLAHTGIRSPDRPAHSKNRITREPNICGSEISFGKFVSDFIHSLHFSTNIHEMLGFILKQNSKLRYSITQNNNNNSHKPLRPYCTFFLSPICPKSFKYQYYIT
jgi:hypothetical protein